MHKKHCPSYSDIRNEDNYWIRNNKFGYGSGGRGHQKIEKYTMQMSPKYILMLYLVNALSKTGKILF